jgi:nitrogen fixation protein NifB
MSLQFENHPCFNPDVKGKFGRVHLPVAPKCNVQCRYCNRKYDCVNESRPGVTSTLLSPGQAFQYVARLVDMEKPISVVGIAGPGDPFANPHETMESMRLIRRKFPDMLLCVSTNGLGVAPYIAELAELQVSHVTITMNAIDAEIAGGMYAWIRDGKKVLRGLAAGERMIERQIAAINALKEAGIVVKVNTILVPGHNESHVVEVAEFCKQLGVDLHNIIPLCPVAGTDFADVAEPSDELIASLRAECGQHVTQMTHCQRCRADACGLLSEGTTQATLEMLHAAASQPIHPAEERPYVAVASHEGLLVNQHLGESSELIIYAPADGQFQEIERRATPERGCGDNRWEALADRLRDCRALLVSSIGPRPTDVLTQSGLRVVVMEGLIDEALTNIYGGTTIKAPVREFACGAGASCGGDGMGCG